MAKNYTRENSAKDAFSLWELENKDLVLDLNGNITDSCNKLLQFLQDYNVNQITLQKLVNNLESSIVDLHCKFEDWCFSEQS